MKHIVMWAALLSVAACGPYIRPEPILRNGAVVPATADASVARAAAEAEVIREQAAGQGGEIVSAALASCAPPICAAVARGELALGMTPQQVFAATRTTESAWFGRASGRAEVLTARSGVARPADAISEVAFVALQDGRVRSYTYREPQGLRVVASAADATAAGRTAAQAESLLRQGDEMVVAGLLDEGLERYDRADILRPNDPETTLRIARTLDKQLRPLEAIMRYQLFIHQMELERIAAYGNAAAQMADAIAQARQRIIVLERR